MTPSQLSRHRLTAEGSYKIPIKRRKTSEPKGEKSDDEPLQEEKTSPPKGSVDEKSDDEPLQEGKTTPATGSDDEKSDDEPLQEEKATPPKGSDDEKSDDEPLQDGKTTPPKGSDDEKSDDEPSQDEWGRSHYKSSSSSEEWARRDHWAPLRKLWAFHFLLDFSMNQLFMCEPHIILKLVFLLHLCENGTSIIIRHHRPLGIHHHCFCWICFFDSLMEGPLLFRNILWP